MKTRAPRTKVKLVLDGKSISEKEYAGKSSEIQHAITLSEREIVAFSNIKLFEKWVASSPQGVAYRREKERMGKALDLIHRIGEDEARRLFDQLQVNLDGAAQCMNMLVEGLSERGEELRTEGIAETVEIFRILLSPKVGTVMFYKDPNYGSQFHGWQGLFHISSWYVGNGDNDTLSSLRDYGAIITLCEDSGWGGRRWTFVGRIDIESFAVSPFAWFNDMMSSYWFWA